MTNPTHATLRIIDANLNRAREALRVMEEYARLGLDDAGLSAVIKQARHALAQTVLDLEGGATPGGSLIAHRDIVGDVGCEVSTPSEYERSGEYDVAVAAGKRLSEALRVIEEYGKTIDRDFAAAIERLRYRGYELQRRLELTAASHRRFGNVRLYVLLTESLCSGDWFTTAEAALAGGAHCLQLREKELPDRELLDRAKRLVTLCRQHNALLIVNDRPDIAVLSKHTPEQLAAAAEAVPDYIAVGPMFPTSTKPQDYIAGPQALAAARRSTSLPLVAVGGIEAENAREVLSAGHCCLCVCRSVISQPDVANAAARLRAVIDQTGTGTAADGH